MKYLFSLALMLGLVRLNAQTTGDVEFIEDPAAATVIRNKIIYNCDITEVQGYRVMIGFYNSRSTATREQSNAITLWGKDHITKLKFDEPNWKVFIGEFEEKADAERFLQLVRKKYPGARIIKDIISTIPIPSTEEEE